jgi:hypothetical protein
MMYAEINQRGVNGIALADAVTAYGRAYVDLLLEATLAICVNGTDSKCLVADAFLRQWSLQCYSRVSDEYHATTRLQANDQEMSKYIALSSEVVILRPWLTLNGELNTSFLQGIYERLLTTIINKPGISEVCRSGIVHNSMLRPHQ